MAIDTSTMNWNEVLFRAADAYLNGTAVDPTTIGDILDELVLIYGVLNTPATSIPHTATDATNDLSYAFSSLSSSGEADLVTAGTGSQTIRGYRMAVSAAGATTLEFLDGAGGTALYTMEFPAAGAYVLDFDPRPYFVGSAATKLVRKSSNAVKVVINLRYLKN